MNYEILNKNLKNLIEGERNFIANAANCASLIFNELPDISWAGFYMKHGDELILGPFSGKTACIRITVGKGVCGTAAEKAETVIVPDVHEFPGHIACDPESNSEIVLPMIYQDRLIGVLDLDSTKKSRFDDEDKAGLEELVQTLLSGCDIDSLKKYYEL